MSTFSFANSPKIVVVGGGLAGLTTAYRLHKAGMSVDLYEARARLGGRILTAEINGHYVELGAQNITDGGQAANLNNLINEFGLQRVSSRVSLNHSYFNGIDLTPINEILKDKKIDPDILKIELAKLASTHSNMKEILEKIVDPEDPLYKILSVRMAAFEGGPIDKLSPIYTETLFHMLLGGICAVHQGNREEDSSVDLVTIDGGNSILPQKMGEALGLNLHLNMPLRKVSKGKNGKFELTFENSTKIETDILVLAIPCSVYDQIAFENNVIPTEKLEAIQNVQYGQNAKIIIPYINTSSEFTGLITDEIVSFIGRAQKIYTIYYTGSSSSFTAKTIARSYMQARPMIERGLENCPPFENPVYAKDEANQAYEGAVGYSWPNDPYAKGTYSYIASGQESLLTTVKENGEEFKAIFAPIDQNLYFAGEHASILLDIPGTMEAACESGERIARIILKNHSTD